MITNLKCSYLNRRLFYLKVTNKGDLSVRFILQYTIQGGTATKSSVILEKNKSQLIYFPYEAVNVCFNILNYSLPTIPLISHGCIYPLQNTCYEIYGTAFAPACIKIDC